MYLDKNIKKQIDDVMFLATEEDLTATQILELQGLIPSLLETLTDKITELEEELSGFRAEDKDAAARLGWQAYIKR